MYKGLSYRIKQTNTCTILMQVINTKHTFTFYGADRSGNEDDK